MTVQQTAMKPLPTSDDTPKIRRALANGRTIQWCADAYGWPRHRIKALIDDTPGWLVDPDRDTAHIFRDDEAEPEPDTDAKAIAMTPTDQESTSDLEGLLRRGEQSENAATRAAAKKTRTAVEDLRQRIKTEDAEKQVRDRINGLEAQLAAAREQLRGIRPKKQTTVAPRPAVADGLTASEVRAWAKDQGITCPTHGRIPKTVTEQYKTAHGLAVETAKADA